jgi:dihydrodipicolinate synthase/N-acetylneuraminate lyase
MLMQCKALTDLEGDALVAAYGTLTALLPHPVIIHELPRVFAPAFGRLYTPYEYAHLMKLRNVVGGKVSSLYEPGYLWRQAMARDLGLPAPFSGDDYAVGEAMRCGGNLLLGAGCVVPGLYRALIEMWTSGDNRFHKLLNAVQALANVQFRADRNNYVGAYKHSTACLLKLLEVIPSAGVPPGCADCDRRPADEEERMNEALAQLRFCVAEFGIPLVDWEAMLRVMEGG